LEGCFIGGLTSTHIHCVEQIRDLILEFILCVSCTHSAAFSRVGLRPGFVSGHDRAKLVHLVVLLSYLGFFVVLQSKSLNLFPKLDRTGSDLFASVLACHRHNCLRIGKFDIRHLSLHELAFSDIVTVSRLSSAHWRNNWAVITMFVLVKPTNICSDQRRPLPIHCRKKLLLVSVNSVRLLLGS
jgi:hypothetical protein